MWTCNICGLTNSNNYEYCQRCKCKRGTKKADPSKEKKWKTVAAAAVALTLTAVVILGISVLGRHGGPEKEDENLSDTVAMEETVTPVTSPTPATPVPSSSPILSPTAVPSATPTIAPTETPAPTQNVITPASVPPKEEHIQREIPIPANPVTPIGKAYRNYATGAKEYTTESIVNIIGETYNNRKDASGNYKPGWTRDRNKDNEYGYDFGFYYGDKLLYFAEVRSGKPAVDLVKLYYWGDEIVACRDYRGDDHSLYMSGTPQLEAIAEEFAYLYDLGKKQ